MPTTNSAFSCLFLLLALRLAIKEQQAPPVSAKETPQRATRQRARLNAERGAAFRTVEFCDRFCISETRGGGILAGVSWVLWCCVGLVAFKARGYSARVYIGMVEMGVPGRRETLH